jgi:mono/diheme cytochrome c family protein
MSRAASMFLLATVLAGCPAPSAPTPSATPTAVATPPPTPTPSPTPKPTPEVVAASRSQALTAWIAALDAGRRDAANPVAGDNGRIEEGARDFARVCASCHGDGAAGDGPFAERLERPPLDLTDPRNAQPPGVWYALLDGGLEGVKQSYRYARSEEQLWALVAWLQTRIASPGDLPGGAPGEGPSGTARPPAGDGDAPPGATEPPSGEATP